MSLGASIAAAAGQLTGAVGQTLSGMSAGTAECGARPLRAKNREEWQKCVDQNTAIRQQMTQADAMRSAQEQAPAGPNWLVIGGIIVAVIVVIMLIKKR